MIKLITALLILSVMVATVTAANAWCNCNRNAPRCRQICPPPRHDRHHHATQTQTQFAIALTPTAAAPQRPRVIAGPAACQNLRSALRHSSGVWSDYYWAAWINSGCP